MTQRPSFQFYPRDWMNDLELRQCSAEARCLWIDMLCIMHDGEPYGHLHTAAGDIPMRWLANRTGLTLKAIGLAMADLEKHGVFSRTEAVAAAANGTAGSTGNTIYSRRMVRDEQSRSNRATYGKLHSAEFVNQSSRQTTIVESDDITKVRIAQESRRNSACVEISASESPKTPSGSTPRSTPRSISTTNVSSSSSSSSSKDKYKYNPQTPKTNAPDGASVEGLKTSEPTKAKQTPKKIREDLISDWFFRDFWPLYPRKDGQKPALKKAHKALIGIKPSDVMAGLRRQLPVFATRDRDKIPLPGTWLSEQRWLDELGMDSHVPVLTDQKSTWEQLPIYLPAED